MIRLAALLLLAAAAHAQTITGLKIGNHPDGGKDIGTHCIPFAFTVSGLSGSTAFTFEAGATTSLGQARGGWSSSQNIQHFAQMCPADADSDWYFKVTVGSTESLCAGACTNCGSGDSALFADSSGFNCGGAGQPPYWHSAAVPGNINPVAPTHGVDGLAAYEYTYDSTVQTNCAGLGPAIATAAAGVEDVRIQLATDETCLLDSLTLPTNSNTIIIEPDVAANLLLTPGAQISPDEPHVAHIRRSSAKLGEGVSATFISANGKSNYIFRQVKIDDDPQPYAPTVIGVTAIALDTPSSGKTTLTLASSCPTGLGFFDTVWLNLPSATSYPSTSQVDSCAGTSLVLLASGFTGTTPGAGATIAWGSNVPVDNCDQGTPVICTTTAPHGLPTGNYTGQDALFIGDVNNVPMTTYHFTVLSSTTFSLTDSTGGAAYVASDYDFMRFASAPQRYLIDAASSTNIHILQSILGTPWRGQYSAHSLVAGGSSTGLIVRDSLLYSGNNGCIISPSTGLPHCAPTYSGFAGEVLTFTSASDTQLENNAIFDCLGICFNSQDSNSAQLKNLTIKGNQFRASERVVTDVLEGVIGVGWNVWSQARHIIELKAGCQFCEISYNVFSGNAADTNAPQGYAIFLNDTPNGTGTANPKLLESIDIHHNLIERVAQCIAITSSSNSNEGRNRTFHRRIRVADNWCSQSHTERRLAPGSGGSTAKAGGAAAGAQIIANVGGEFFQYTGNTWFRSGGSGAGIAFFCGNNWLNLVAENNVFVWHDGTITGAEGITAWGGDVATPYTTTNYQTRFDSCTVGAASFASNLIVPGVEAAANVAALKSSTSDGDTKTEAECETAWEFGSGSFAGVACVPGASYQNRHDAVFAGGLWTQGAYTAYGVTGSEVAGMLDGFGMTRSVNAFQTGATLDLDWRAPTTTACGVRLFDGAGALVERKAATGGSQAQSVQFTSLAAGSYSATIECPNGVTLLWSAALE